MGRLFSLGSFKDLCNNVGYEDPPVEDGSRPTLPHGRARR